MLAVAKKNPETNVHQKNTSLKKLPATIQGSSDGMWFHWGEGQKQSHRAAAWLQGG